MKVVVYSRTTYDMTEYNNVASITKVDNNITLTYGNAATATYSVKTHDIFVLNIQ